MATPSSKSFDGLSTGLIVFLVFIGIFILIPLFWLVGGAILYIALNGLFGLAITFWQCVGLYIVISLIGGAFKSTTTVTK